MCLHGKTIIILTNWKVAKISIAEIFQPIRRVIHTHWPLNATKHLCISKDTAKINMKHVPRLLYHNIVIMTITDTQYVCRYTVTSTWSDKAVCCLGDKIKRQVHYATSKFYIYIIIYVHIHMTLQDSNHHCICDPPSKNHPCSHSVIFWKILFRNVQPTSAWYCACVLSS